MYRRRFIIGALPDAITPSDEHLQIFENYIGETGLRLRSVRRPSTDERARYLERVRSDNRSGATTESLELTAEEYEAMRPLRGRELRKNRYEYEEADTRYLIDVYLGPLWGLNVATAYFESEAACENFEPPGFSLLEISEDRFFSGVELCDKEFDDVRRKFQKAKGEG